MHLEDRKERGIGPVVVGLVTPRMPRVIRRLSPRESAGVLSRATCESVHRGSSFRTTTLRKIEKYVILFIEIMMHYLLPHSVAPTASLPVVLIFIHKQKNGAFAVAINTET